MFAGRVVSCLNASLLLLVSVNFSPVNSVAQAPVAAGDSAALKYPGEALRNGIKSLLQRHEYAIGVDPRSCDGHVGVVETSAMLWCFGFVPREEVWPRMQVAAQEAIDSHPQDAGARTALGIVKFADWDWAAAEKELATAVRLDPKRATSRHWYALYLASRGRHAEALKQAKKAVELDTSVGMQVGKASIHYFARDWDSLIAQMHNAINQDAKFAPAHDWLGMAYVQQRKFDEAIPTYERAVELSGGLAEILAGLGHAYAQAGQRDKADTVLKKLESLDRKWYVPPVQIAFVHIGLGQHDQAIKRLHQAVDERSWELVFLQVEPWLDPVRDDPRFAKILDRLQFPD